mgnify:FL=1
MKPLSLHEFAERVSAVMPVMCKSMVRYEQNALTKGEVSLPQFWAMSWLATNRDATMHDLARAMNMKASTATMLVDRLVEARLLSRERDGVDRRRVLVRLTNKGRTMLEEVHTQKRKALQETFRPLTPDERQQYLHLIETLAQRLEDN